MAVEHFDARTQAGERGFLRHTVKFAFVGVDPTHEPFAGMAVHRPVVTMEIAMQCQLVAPGEPGTELAAKLRMGVQIVVFVEVRDHQPGDRHITQGGDGFDERLVIDPGGRCHVVQYQQQSGTVHGLSHWLSAAIGCRARRDSAAANC
ncbi:hypothetical protein D3C78_1309180 [compost metagenome]